MKNILYILAFLPMLAFSETKYEIAKELVDLNHDQEEAINTLQNSLVENRQRTIKLLTDTFEVEGLPQDIIALNEQLKLDAYESELFVMNFDALKDAAAMDMVENFTYDELLEIRTLYLRPIYKKLTSLNKNNMRSIEKYTSQWRVYNEELVAKFQKRAMEINKLTKEFIDEKIENQH